MTYVTRVVNLHRGLYCSTGRPLVGSPVEYNSRLKRGSSHCSCAKLREVVDPGSVDLIVTDPPYAKSCLPLWTELGEFAVHALKPGGFLVSMCSNIHTRESEDALEKAGMKIRPRMVYMLPGAKESIQYGRLSFICEAKFLIVASNGDLPEPISLDSNVVRPPVKSVQDDTRHRWEQSVGGMTEICRRFMKIPGIVMREREEDANGSRRGAPSFTGINSEHDEPRIVLEADLLDLFSNLAAAHTVLSCGLLPTVPKAERLDGAALFACCVLAAPLLTNWGASAHRLSVALLVEWL